MKDIYSNFPEVPLGETCGVCLEAAGKNDIAKLAMRENCGHFTCRDCFSFFIQVVGSFAVHQCPKCENYQPPIMRGPGTYMFTWYRANEKKILD